MTIPEQLMVAVQKDLKSKWGDPSPLPSPLPIDSSKLRDCVFAAAAGDWSEIFFGRKDIVDSQHGPGKQG